MQISAILDVALGLAFTFFLLSLIASGLQEVIAGIFTWRGTYLAKAIDVIMDNEPSARFVWYGLGDWFRAHFTSAPGATAAEQSPIQNPVLQRVMQGMSTHPLLRGTPTGLPSYVPARNFSMALLEVLRDGSSLPLFSQVENTIAALPDGDLKTTLRTFVQDAAGDIDRFRSHVEQWFGDAMDRVSGIYKRLSQYALIILGLVLAAALNVDTFHLARTLWDVPASRAAVVASAAGATQHLSVQDALADLQRQPLPLGWGQLAGLHAIVRAIVWAIPGWIVTALAVSLGAPFWFDLLQNLSNLRAAGPKPNGPSNPVASGGSS